MQYNQPTDRPTAKVAAVGTAGAIVTAVVMLLAVFGVIIPAELSAQAEQALVALFVVVSGVQAIAQFAAGYYTKSKKSELPR